jgi:F-box protein 9
MDPDVDKHYLQKYFPSGGAKPAAHPRDDLHTTYATTEYRPPKQGHIDPLKALIATFSELSLLPQIEPEDPQKQCFLAALPDELLLHIILQLSLSSLSSLSRTAQVCKKLLLLTTAEASLYKTLCKHYFEPFSGVSERLLGDFGGDWRRMLIERPRLRFDGCYIATCHYLRPGVNDFSWNTPIHMVTYFRFLRLYPDGRVISCLTTVEPREVVHSLSWSGIWGLKGVSEGRWRMTETGEMNVEVRGPRGYVFVMELMVKSTVRGKHNKLAWMGFHSINQEDREKTVQSPCFPSFAFLGVF